ncbi:MAG: FkbM family methyltransferase [Flavobacteriales bacterium]|nr:FkbM family methyltransferase [Flavobacteriales bacterium]
MLNKLITKLGYSLRKLDALNSFPYKKSYNSNNVKFDLWIADETASEWYDKGFEDNKEELGIISSMLDSGDKVLEVGVHYGFFASFISAHVTKGKYLGIEMQPKAAMHAQANLSLNEFPNARIINSAGGRESGEIDYVPNINGNSAVSKGGNTGFKIPVLSIDEIISKEGQMNFLKIDVEGHEIEVLKGAKNSLKNFSKIAIEIHNTMLSKAQIKELVELLSIEDFKGKMFIRPNYKLEEIDIEKIIHSPEIVNLFIWK